MVGGLRVAAGHAEPKTVLNDAGGTRSRQSSPTAGLERQLVVLRPLGCSRTCSLTRFGPSGAGTLPPTYTGTVIGSPAVTVVSPLRPDGQLGPGGDLRRR